MKKNLFITILIFILLGVLLPFSSAQAPVLKITILYSNDFHGAEMELLAKRATIIKQIRAESAHPVFVFDEGDVFGRGRYEKKFYGELEFAVLNKLQYDAVVLGNNEFKATEDISAQKILLDRIKQAEFPVLCGNVIEENTGNYLPGVKPYIIKECKEIKIGFIGLTSSRINTYRQLKGWKSIDPILAGKKLFNELKGQTDIIIAITHIGFDLDQDLAENISGLRAIIGGDSHTVLIDPVIINGIPIVQAGESGYFLGKLDLTFEKKDSVWLLSQVEGKLIELNDDQIKPDPVIKGVIDSYLNQLKKKVS